MDENGEKAAEEHAVAVEEALEEDTGPHIHVFYHDDLDGECAAAIVNQIYDDDPGLVFYPLRYDSGVDFGKIRPGEPVFVLDFTFPKEVFLGLFSITEDIVWIDHHKTRIERVYDEGRLAALPGTRTNDLPCAALCSWFQTKGKAEVPVAVHYIEKWDTWTHGGDEKVLAFIAGMKVIDTEPQAAVWSMLLTDTSPGVCDPIIENGRIVLAYKTRRSAKLVRALGWEGKFEGLKAFCCNLPAPSSMDFTSLAGEGYDVYVAYEHNGEVFSVTIYAAHSKVPHLGELAAKWGGAGHKQAASCRVGSIEFLLRDEVALSAEQVGELVEETQAAMESVKLSELTGEGKEDKEGENDADPGS